MVYEQWGGIGKFKTYWFVFKGLCELGPQFGYSPEESKSILVVRKNDVEKADNFKRDNGSNFKIKTSYRYLGSYIGEKG